MKASKILAGLSAAAIAASMFSMVSVYAAEEVGNSGNTKVEITDEASAWWTQASIPVDELLGDVSPEDVVGIEFETADDVDFLIGYNSTEVTGKDATTGEDSYWKQTEKGKSFRLDDINFTSDIYYLSVVIGTGNVGDSCNISWNVLVDNGEEDSESATDSESAADSESATDSESKADPVAIELPYTVDTGVGYAGDWSGDGFVPLSAFEAIPEGEGATITINYTLEDGYDYYLAGPFSNNTGWMKLYAEGERDTIEGIDLKSSFTAEELEEHGSSVGTPVLQNDGYIIAYPAGGKEQTATFTLNADGIALLKKQAAKFPDDEGGLGFQVYGIDVTEVTVDYKAAEEDNSVVYEIGEGISYNNPFHFEPTDLDEDVEYTSATLTLEGMGTTDDPAYWNDWCCYKIVVTDAEGNKTYYAVGGSEVGWDVTVEDAEKEEDKIIILNADVIKAEAGTGKVVVNTPFSAGSTIDVIAMGWNDSAESADCPYILLKEIALGFESIDVPDSSSVVDTTSSTAASDSSSNADATTSTTSSTASSSSSSASSSSKATTSTTTTAKTDTNPSTGAAALGAVGVLLAGAAMVVSKKKD